MSKHESTEINPVENSNLSPTESQTEKTYTEPLLTPENFKRLRQLQQDIFTICEMTPSFRKLINTFITDESVQVVKSKFLNDMHYVS